MAERRYTMVFYGALVVAGLATFGVYQTISTLRAQSHVPTRPVVVVVKDIPEGTMIDKMQLTTKLWPAATVPVGAFSTPDSVAGRITRVAVFAGEPVIPGRLAPIGASAGLETKVPAGQRAMAVRINDVAGISGLLQPNSRVDVLVTLNDGTPAMNDMAKLFMENMQVLSVGTTVQRDNEGKPINATTVTLSVTPDQAERLAIAMNRGSIQLVLRGFGDPDTVRTQGATTHDVLAQLRGAPPVSARALSAPVVERRVARSEPARVVMPPPPPPTRPESVHVEVYRGDKSTRQAFDKPAEPNAGKQ